MLKRSPLTPLAGLAVRLPPAAAALMGAAGVALAAVAAHMEGAANVMLAANFLLFHAPAILALSSMAPRSRAMRLAQTGLIAGPLLFSGTLALGVLAGVQVSPSPAPLGGGLTILAWLLAAFAILAGRASK